MFTEKLWESWSLHEESNYKTLKNKNGQMVEKYLKKGYTHFDLRFWFPNRKDELKKILQNGLRVYNKNHKRDEWWSFAPFLKILIKTPRYKYQEDEKQYDLETKIRPICFASHIDSLIFGYYAYMLTRKYEEYINSEGISDCVLAYRSNLDGKCNIQFSKEVFEEVRTRKECTAIALDIRGYFDHIDHIILKEKWTKVWGEKLPADQYKIYKALTQYSYVNKATILTRYNVNLKKIDQPKSLLELIPGEKDYEKFQRLRDDNLIVTNHTTDKKTGRSYGIPQGSGMSALLSNIYLIDYDKMMMDKAQKEGFIYRRYCDDILIICDTAKAFALNTFAIEKIKNDYYLEIQDKKVEMTEFRFNSKGKIRAFDKKKMDKQNVLSLDASNEKTFYKSLQYLGFEFNGKDIFIRSSSLSRYFRKMKARIIKTVCMAYSDKKNPDKIWKEQILHRYTHLGKRNFLKYAYNASKEEYVNSSGEIKIGMNSPAIKKQVRRHYDILMKNLEYKNLQRFVSKANKGKATKLKEL